jgi:hypothetical protein
VPAVCQVNPKGSKWRRPKDGDQLLASHLIVLGIIPRPDRRFQIVMKASCMASQYAARLNRIRLCSRGGTAIDLPIIPLAPCGTIRCAPASDSPVAPAQRCRTNPPPQPILIVRESPPRRAVNRASRPRRPVDIAWHGRCTFPRRGDQWPADSPSCTRRESFSGRTKQWF